MKKLLLFGLLLTLFSCTKPEPLTEGVITGYDYRKCACCGGLMINFDGETENYEGNYYLIENSSELGIGHDEKFPIYVQVAYSKVNSSCNVARIIHIDKLKRK